MKTSVNTNNIESNNGMSQVINILTGDIKKIRCHYLSKRTDKPVSRVLTLERLDHPALTAAGVTAWAERFNDGVNSFDWLRVSIQLTDKICYTPNCANVGLPDVENYGNLDYYKNQEGAMRVYMNNVDKFFQNIADKPAKMMTGEDWPNMAVIAAYRAAGRDEEADTLTAARDIYNARREADREAWRKEWEEKKRKEQEKQNSFAEGMRVKVPAASLERNRDKEAFVITRIRRKAAENGGNASLTVKSELTGVERDINGSDVSEILPALQEASEITDFFTKGKKYRCIKSVVMKKGGKTAFKAGSIYEQTNEPTHWVGWLRNEQGERHGWPQPVYIADEVKTWGTKPEDIDPRLYFEPVEDTKEAEDIPAADLCWDEDEEGVKVWGNIELHADNLKRMGAKRGRVVFKSNKTGLPTGADCWVLPKTKSEDVRQYVRKVHECIICDFSEAREKYGNKGHEYHDGEKVVTIYGRGTVVRGRACYASDLIDVQLDAPTYNYIWSLLGTPQKMVAVNRNDIVSIELPEPPKEIIIEDATLQEASEIKPKATDCIESRKRTIIARAKQDKQAWRMYNGYEVRVRKAYTNGSRDPENWSYCVSWYADGQLVECENGVRLEQAARALNDLPRWAEARKAA